MDIGDLLRDLRWVLDGDERSRLSASLHRLVAHLVDTVPSCTAIWLSLLYVGELVTIRLLGDGLSDERCVASLRMPLAHGSADEAVLAQSPLRHAFAALHAELLAAAVEGPQPLLDRHLRSLGAGSDFVDGSVVAQASGVLLDRGWLPDEAMPELERRARRYGVSRVAAARLLLLETSAGSRSDSADGDAC